VTELELLGAALPAYDFQDVLGRGAWGIVVAAHHRRLNRPVAVKMLPLAFTSDDRVRRRFAAEARLLATLDHPHVVRIHDYIEQDEVCALVMERLTGGTLAERMQLGRMRQEHASAIQLATLHGLEHAHQHGVLHRDIKPENLMFAADGVLKITDFGIATVLGEQVERLTAAGIAMGTPAYMAPEQVSESAEVGEAADIWSAAAVYYEMLSGAVPYPRKASLQAALLARTRDEPKPIDEVAPDLPPQIGGPSTGARRSGIPPAPRSPTRWSRPAAPCGATTGWPARRPRCTRPPRAAHPAARRRPASSTSLRGRGPESASAGTDGGRTSSSDFRRRRSSRPE
jgi:serine/threonine-protein kinase